MEVASQGYVKMDELFERSGAFLADLLGTESVYVTSGGAAALTLSAAACMTGTDTARIHALPDAAGMKSEILVQKKHIPSYDRCLRAAGATIVEAGGDESCTEDELGGGDRPQHRGHLLLAPALRRLLQDSRMGAPAGRPESRLGRRRRPDRAGRTACP